MRPSKCFIAFLDLKTIGCLKEKVLFLKNQRNIALMPLKTVKFWFAKRQILCAFKKRYQRSKK